jgi:hypothetical protein
MPPHTASLGDCVMLFDRGAPSGEGSRGEGADQSGFTEAREREPLTRSEIVRKVSLVDMSIVVYASSRRSTGTGASTARFRRPW